MKKLLWAALAAMVVVCLSLAAHAQAPDATDVGGAITTAIDAGRAHDWQVALAAVLGLAAWALRRFAQPSHAFHTKAGAIGITAACTAIGALVPVLQAHAFTVAALVGALTSGVTAALALSNPSTLAAKQSAPPPSSLLLLVGLGFALALPACACFKAENAQKPECVIERQVIDCTKQAGSSLLPVVGSILSGFINSGSFAVDWSWVEQRLEAAGVVSGSCVFADLTNDLTTKAAASPERAARAREAEDRFAAWKVRHGLVGVRFKIRTADGREVLR